MAFSTLIFLLAFLPIACIASLLLMKQKEKQKSLLAIVGIVLSFLFYAWGEPKGLILLLFLLLCNFFVLKWLEKKSLRVHRFISWALAIANLLVLAYAKYFASAMPLGISFYTFRLLSAIFDRWRAKKEQREEAIHFMDFALYIAFFPQVISGPIQRYEDFHSQVQKLHISKEDFSWAINRFLPALFLKVLIADPIFQLRKDLLAAPQMGAAEAWLAAFLYSLYIFLDFSSYSSMAIALSRLFGIHCPENFRYPYVAVSVSDFWRRWHISLSSFFRDYVYIPLGGNRKGQARQVLNIFIVWALTGIWHGSSVNFLLWGLYFALFLLLEKFILGKWVEKVPSFFRQLLTFFIVTIAWVLFAFPKYQDLLAYFAALFARTGWTNGQSLYIISGNLILLALAVLACFPIAEKLKERILNPANAKGNLQYYLVSALRILVLILCFAYLLDQSFASFLYFQF